MMYTYNETDLYSGNFFISPTGALKIVEDTSAIPQRAWGNSVRYGVQEFKAGWDMKVIKTYKPITEMNFLRAAARYALRSDEYGNPPKEYKAGAVLILDFIRHQNLDLLETQWKKSCKLDCFIKSSLHDEWTRARQIVNYTEGFVTDRPASIKVMNEEYLKLLEEA